MQKTHFTKTDIQVANNHRKKSLTSSDHQEIQISASTRYHCIPIRMTKIFFSWQYQGSTKVWTIGTLTHCWWEYKLENKTTEIYYLKVLKARSPKSRYVQGHVPPETYRGILPCLLLAFGNLVSIFGVFKLVDATLQSSIFTWCLPLSLHVAFFL